MQDGTKLWLWKNGDHYLAFTHLYPCITPGGDPMVLGEPAAIAIFKESHDRATTPLQAEPDSRQNCRNFTAGKDGDCVHCYAKVGQECQYEPTSDDALSDRYVEQRAEIARLTAELAQANAMCESLAASVQDLANAKAAVDEAHAIELADEKAVVDVLRSELQDRLQKQRAAEAELQEVRKDAGRYRWLREQAWFAGPLCVLRDPKAVLTRGAFLGADCPSLSRLDDAIDAAMIKEKPNGSL